MASDSFNLFLGKVLAYGAACAVLHISLRPVVRLFPTIEAKYRGDWINRCVATIHGNN